MLEPRNPEVSARQGDVDIELTSALLCGFGPGVAGPRREHACAGSNHRPDSRPRRSGGEGAQTRTAQCANSAATNLVPPAAYCVAFGFRRVFTCLHCVAFLEVPPAYLGPILGEPPGRTG